MVVGRRAAVAVCDPKDLAHFCEGLSAQPPPLQLRPAAVPPTGRPPHRPTRAAHRCTSALTAKARLHPTAVACQVRGSLQNLLFEYIRSMNSLEY